jgi:hypothetical protein
LVDELVDQELSGKHANHGHIVFDAADAAILELSDQCGHCLSVKDSVPSDGFGGKQLFCIIRSRCAKEALSIWRAVRLLWTAGNGIRNDSLERSLEQMLLIQHFHFQVRRKFGGELDHPMIKKRITPFHGVSHGHPIALRGKNISRQKIFCFQILGAPKV